MTLRPEQLQQELKKLRRERSQEQAAERVSVKALSMYASEDLLDVLMSMRNELLSLGLESPSVGFFFVQEEQNIQIYMSFENPRKHGLTWTSELLQEVDSETVMFHWDAEADESWEEDLRGWRSGEMWSPVRTSDEDEEEMRQFHEKLDMDGVMPFVGSGGRVVNVPFTHGWIAIRHREIVEEPLAMAEGLTDALSLAYLRARDFLRLEDRNEQLEQALQEIGAAQN